MRLGKRQIWVSTWLKHHGNDARAHRWPSTRRISAILAPNERSRKYLPKHLRTGAFHRFFERQPRALPSAGLTAQKKGHFTGFETSVTRSDSFFYQSQSCAFCTVAHFIRLDCTTPARVGAICTAQVPSACSPPLAIIFQPLHHVDHHTWTCSCTLCASCVCSAFSARWNW